jgi:hypothetical protein
MMLNSTFNNISVISWRSVLLVEEAGVSRVNHWPATSHWQTLSHKVVSSTPHNTCIHLAKKINSIVYFLYMLKSDPSELVFIRLRDIYWYNIESLHQNANLCQIFIHSFSRASHQHEIHDDISVLSFVRNITILILRVKFGQTDCNIFVSIGPYYEHYEKKHHYCRRYFHDKNSKIHKSRSSKKIRFCIT